MPSVNDLKVNENFVALVVGKAGAGKTSAIASFASKDTPLYVFDIDHRIRGILGSRQFIGEDAFNNITYDQYDVKDGFKSIENQFMEFAIKYDKRQLQYKNILIESVGSLGRMFLRDSLSLRGVKPGIDLSKLSGEQKKGMRIVGNVAFPTPADYQYASQCFHILFYNYFTHFTKCNIFLSGWTVDRWIDDPNSDNQYAPQIVSGTQLLATNKIASEVPGYFDEIWEFDKIETGKASNPVQFVVKFKSAMAKTSISGLPNGNIDITNKSFKQKLFELIGDKNESNKVVGQVVSS